MLWLSPFWWIAMIPALEIFRRRWFPSLAGTLLLVSMISVGWSINRPWRPSWLYEQMEASGWIHYRTSPKPFDPPRNAVFNNVPEMVGTTMAWRSTDHDQLSLTVESAATENSRRSLLAIQLNGETLRATWDVDAFHQGRPMNEFFQIDEPKDALLARRIRELIQGLPSSRPFNSAGPTWIPSKSNPTKAWKVERAAARVLIDDPLFGKCWHRCDVMYCDQLPFGVLQWKTTIISETTGVTLSTITWMAENY
jgi:hypothetical protein